MATMRIVIYGVAGVGKTVLANVIAHSLREIGYAAHLDDENDEMELPIAFVQQLHDKISFKSRHVVIQTQRS